MKNKIKVEMSAYELGCSKRPMSDGQRATLDKARAAGIFTDAAQHIKALEIILERSKREPAFYRAVRNRIPAIELKLKRLRQSA